MNPTDREDETQIYIVSALLCFRSKRNVPTPLECSILKIFPTRFLLESARQPLSTVGVYHDAVSVVADSGAENFPVERKNIFVIPRSASSRS